MGTSYLIDTNIISKFFDGSLSANSIKWLSQLEVNEQNISVINRIELLSWNGSKGERLAAISSFISEMNEFGLSEPIIERTIKIRKGRVIKLPDAIIAATAIVNDLTLLSDNDKDFERISGLKYFNPTKI